MKTDPVIYLASKSPRRRALLEQIGVRYQLLNVEVDETYIEGEDPESYVVRLALEKARAGWRLVKNNNPLPVMGADTAVVIGRQVLGQPENLEEGLAMLGSLSGCDHRVLTAVALVTNREKISTSETIVTFREITRQEQLAYWQFGEGRGKAGGYAIQGMASIFVENISGSYSGVVGLPLFETAGLLSEYKIDLL